MFSSLTARITLVLCLVLLLFLPLAGLVLERAYGESLDERLHEQLKVQIYALLGLADELAPGQLWLPEVLPDERFNQINSGLYAQVADSQGNPLWRSQSSLNLALPSILPNVPGEINIEDIRPPGQFSFETVDYADIKLERAELTVIWESGGNVEHIYTFSVAEDLSPFLAEKKTFRVTLLLWLGGLSLFLILIQIVALRFVMRPLNRLAKDIHAVESGEVHRLSMDYPNELKPAAENINALVEHEQSQRTRYRNTLQDLAHSLKTPLSVISGLIRETGLEQEQRKAIDSQIERMNNLVVYQLQKAVTAGSSPILIKTTINDSLNDLLSALTKVYQEQNIEISNHVPSSTVFYGDANDFMEIMGNLCDNACKYGNGIISVDCQQRGENWLQISVTDNGHGVPDSLVEYIMERGQRLDEQKEGQGIGLAIVKDLVESYKGSLHMNRQEGQNTVIIRLPGKIE